MSKPSLSRREREAAVAAVQADMERRAAELASELFDEAGRRMVAAHPTMRAETLVKRFNAAWAAAIGR